MSTYVYDFEVFRHDWLVVFLDVAENFFHLRSSDYPEDLISFMKEHREDIFVGFNSKGYDQWIMKAIMAGGDCEDVKAMNDYLISGGNGWEHPFFKANDSFYFRNVDLMDDMQKGLSLKAIEGHLGMDIRESSVPFDLDRPLTPQEFEEVVEYCKHDVLATARLMQVRKNYLTTKIDIGRMAGIEPHKALAMTNAKLTAAFLHAEAPEKPWTDERKYVLPANLKTEYIPWRVTEFFQRMYDSSIPDEDLFSEKLDIDIHGTPTTMGFGGIHSAIPNYIGKPDENELILNYDVASYYPHLMTVNGYTSRNMADPKVYADMLEKRMAAKKAGDKVTANALKLIANTTYGATLNKYNDLYDPLMARSVCVSGQLYLLELSMHLAEAVPGLTVVQTNTDGIMVRFPKEQLAAVREIIGEWQKRTGFELEEDAVQFIAQKDVNNYCEVGPDGNVKAKGGYVVRGIAPAGAFNINNNAIIVADAIREYFVHDTPPEDTISACDDVSKFMLIAKAGAKYKEAYHMVGGKRQPVQKVNRVYATLDPRYGKLYKIKAETDGEAMIESLPDHCLIDNTAVDSPEHTKIGEIDKAWYIALARKRIDDFLGVKPEKHTRTKKGEKTMANTQTKENVFLKLLQARAKFLAAAVKKTGKNMKLSYLYFELDDIVPVAMEIFQELHLLPVVNFDDHQAIMTIVNCDDPADVVAFTAPLKEIEPIVSTKTGGEVTNAVQRLGSAITYMRRYLYMLALDIVEADEMEAKTGEKEDPKPQVAPAEPPKPKAPATPVERAEIKQKLTAKDDNADELQIEALKNACRKLAGAGFKEEVTAIAQHTENFTKVSKADCEKLIARITAKLEENNG